MQAASGMQAMPASMARMQAKAAQLAAELELARDCSNKPGSPRSSSTDCPSSSTTARVMAPAPRRMSQVNATNTRPTNLDAAAQTALMQCQKLEAQVQMWKGKHLECERELQRHQDSYMRREEQLQARLAELEQRLNQATPQEEADSAAADADAAVGEPDSGRLVSEQHRSSNRRGPPKAQPLTLEAVQHQMQRGVEDLLHHQRLQLRAEEAAQLRQFRGRLAEVEAQLAADKRAAAADQDSWMSKTIAVREELARTQEVAVKLDAMYRLAEDEAAQLRVQFKAQEDDRQHLIRQVLGLKRQNHHLQQQATALQEELDAIMALEVDEGQQQEERGVQLNLLQHQLMQHGGSRPQSAVLGQARGRPMTAGPAGGGCQKQEGTACWRPLSGLPHAREGRAAGAGDAAAASSMLQQQDNSRHTIQQLQRTLACERRQLRQLRSAYTAELGRRNELQTLLLDSIQQAKRHHAEAAAAYAARCQADAAAGEPWQQQQRPQSGAGGPGSIAGSSSPSRQLQARSKARPASAAPACGSSSSRQGHSWGTADLAAAAAATAAGGEGHGVRPTTACAAGAGGGGGGSSGGGDYCAGEGVLSQQEWCQLLNELLSRQQVLELLLQRSCPDLVAAAQQLHQGQQGAAMVSPVRSHSQQQGQQEQQQGEDELPPQQQLQQFAQQRGLGQLQLEQQDGRGDSCPDDDMFMIAEDDGVSQGSGDGSDNDTSKQPAGHFEGRTEQLEQQPAAEEDCQHQGPEQHWGQQEQQQQGEDMPQQDQQPLQFQRQPQHPPSLSPHCRRSAGAAAAASWQQQSGPAAAAAAGAVPLGSMSVPMMGSFPVRKLLHSSSAHGSYSSAHASHSSSSSSSFHKGRQRLSVGRPESAAAAAAGGGLRGRVSLGDEMSFALRPMSAVSSAASAGQALSKGQHSSPVQQAARHSQRQQQQQAAGAAGSRQQQQLSAQHAAQPDGFSIRSWGGQDSKGAQLMLKSFLAGQ